MKIIINKIIRLYHLLNIFIVYVQKRGIGTYHKVLGFFTAPFLYILLKYQYKVAQNDLE